MVQAVTVRQELATKRYSFPLRNHQPNATLLHNATTTNDYIFPLRELHLTHLDADLGLRRSLS